MGYTESEQSAADGRPIELFDLSIGITHWRITSSGADYEYLGKTYESVPCGRKKIEQTEDPFKDRMELTLPRGHALAALYVSGVPEGEVLITVYRGHEGDFVTFFSGSVEACSHDKNAIPKLICTPMKSGRSGTGRRRRCQRLCDHNLYEYGCNVDQEAYRLDGSIGTISGTTITSAAFATKANDWLTAGKIIVGAATRFIRSHTTDTITIDRTISGALAGDGFTAYAGCDHTGAVCDSKFSNKLNFGGEENLPTKNIYTGASVL